MMKTKKLKKTKQPVPDLTSPQLPSAGKIKKKMKKVVVEEEYESNQDSPVASKPRSEDSKNVHEAESEETMRSKEDDDDEHDFLTAAKRPLAPNSEEEEDNSERTKKQKVETVKAGKGEEEEVKRSAFQRFWSEEDEIAILQGLLDFKQENGTDPLADPVAFHDFIKNSVHVEVETKRMVDKIRKMKSKYMNHTEKKGSFSPHQVAVFELCRRIWGDAENKKRIKPVLKADPGLSAMAEQRYWLFLGKASVEIGYDEAFVKAGLELCDENAKAEMECKWRQLYMDFLDKKLDLTRQESQMVTQAFKGE